MKHRIQETEKALLESDDITEYEKLQQKERTIQVWGLSYTCI